MSAPFGVWGRGSASPSVHVSSPARSSADRGRTAAAPLHEPASAVRRRHGAHRQRWLRTIVAAAVRAERALRAVLGARAIVGPRNECGSEEQRKFALLCLALLLNLERAPLLLQHALVRTSPGLCSCTARTSCLAMRESREKRSSASSSAPESTRWALPAHHAAVGSPLTDPLTASAAPCLLPARA